MSTCKACGKELTETDYVDCCDTFLCFETLYCHEPGPFPDFEKINLDIPVPG